MVALIIVIVGSITGIHGGTRIHTGVDCCISYYTDGRFKEFVQKNAVRGRLFPPVNLQGAAVGVRFMWSYDYQ